MPIILLVLIPIIISVTYRKIFFENKNANFKRKYLFIGFIIKNLLLLTSLILFLIIEKYSSILFGVIVLTLFVISVIWEKNLVLKNLIFCDACGNTINLVGYLAKPKYCPFCEETLDKDDVWNIKRSIYVPVTIIVIKMISGESIYPVAERSYLW